MHQMRKGRTAIMQRYKLPYIHNLVISTEEKSHPESKYWMWNSSVISPPSKWQNSLKTFVDLCGISYEDSPASEKLNRHKKNLCQSSKLWQRAMWIHCIELCYEALLLLRNSIAPVDHKARKIKTGWKNNRIKRDWSVSSPKAEVPFKYCAIFPGKTKT